jgi:hypothetical protein
MSVRITTDVFCDYPNDAGNECGNWTDGAMSVCKVRATAARYNATKSGWKRIKLDGKVLDVCPVCYRKYKGDEVDDGDYHAMNAIVH